MYGDPPIVLSCVHQCQLLNSLIPIFRQHCAQAIYKGPFCQDNDGRLHHGYSQQSCNKKHKKFYVRDRYGYYYINIACTLGPDDYMRLMVAVVLHIPKFDIWRFTIYPLVLGPTYGLLHHFWMSELSNFGRLRLLSSHADFVLGECRTLWGECEQAMQCGIELCS